MKIKFITLHVVAATLFFISDAAWAGGDHLHESTIVSASTTTNNYIQQGVALASASGQHHYKATTSLQWSMGGAFANTSDSSAVSFGLGAQVGKVFISGNFSSDGSTSVVGFGASGTF